MALEYAPAQFRDDPTIVSHCVGWDWCYFYMGPIVRGKLKKLCQTLEHYPPTLAYSLEELRDVTSWVRSWKDRLSQKKVLLEKMSWKSDDSSDRVSFLPKAVVETILDNADGIDVRLVEQMLELAPIIQALAEQGSSVYDFIDWEDWELVGDNPGALLFGDDEESGDY
jgi:hypothetical protein